MPTLLQLWVLCVLTLLGTRAFGQVVTEKLASPIASNYTIRFACLNTGVGRFQFYGNVYRNIFKLFQNWVAGMGGIQLYPRDSGYIYVPYGLPPPQNLKMVPHQVEVILFEVGADTISDIASKTAYTALKIANREFDSQFGPFDAIFVPYGSDFTPHVADLIKDRLIMAPFTSARSVFQCSGDILNDPTKCYNRSSDPPRRYGNVYGTLARAGDYFDVAMQYARLKKAKAIGLVCEDSLFGREACEGVRNTSWELGLPIAKQLTYSTKAVAAMKTAGVDFLIAAVYFDTCQQVLQQLAALAWTPAATVLSTCIGNPALKLYSNVTAYSIGPTQWHKGLSGLNYREPDIFYMGSAAFNYFMYPSRTGFTSAMQFYNAYKAISGGDEPTYHAASALASIYAYHMAAIIARTNEISSTVTGMQRLTRGMGLRTFWGYLGFDSIGMMDQSEDSILTQYDATNNVQVITPIWLATSELIYPAPSYPQRGCLAKSVLECSGNGECQTDGTCKCFSGFMGSNCSEKQVFIQISNTRKEDDLTGLWVAIAVLSVVAAVSLIIAVVAVRDRVRIKRTVTAITTTPAPPSLPPVANGPPRATAIIRTAYQTPNELKASGLELPDSNHQFGGIGDGGGAY